MINIKGGISIKNQRDLATMIEGGKLLSRIKKQLKKTVKVGANASEVEEKAEKLINNIKGATASFKMVPKYYWNTCVNVNSGLVHGIPKKEVVFKKGDLVSVDIGLYYGGFHTDSSFSVVLQPDSRTRHFFEIGEKALQKAIKAVRVGQRIYDISRAIEQEISGANYSPIRALVGHGVGKSLHEEPVIPCFTQGEYSDSPLICQGMTLALEIMYAEGRPEVLLGEDGWTISSVDGKITALFEETVAATKRGPLVLTN